MLVLTDLFRMFFIVVPLVSTDFADVAREIVENWVMKFGAPNVLHTDQQKFWWQIDPKDVPTFGY